MAKTRKERRDRFSFILVLSTYFVFVYAMMTFLKMGETTKDLWLVYIVGYSMGIIYYLFVVARKAVKKHRFLFYKLFVWLIVFWSYFLMIDAMIELFHGDNLPWMHRVYGYFILLLILSVIVFDGVYLKHKKKKRRKRKTNKTTKKKPSKA